MNKLVLLGGALLSYHYADLYYNRFLQVTYDQTDPKMRDIARQLSKLSFFPTFYLPNARLQIIWANKVESQRIPLFRREYLPLRDGGQIAIDWMINEGSKNIVVMTHGLTGGTDCTYMKDAMESLHRAGFTVVCVNQRGVAYSKMITPRYCKVFDPSDLKEAIAHVQKQHPGASLLGVGISKGANLILRYAGMDPDNCQFRAIVSIANPFNLQACAENLKPLKNKIYRDAITKNFIWLMNNNLKELQPNIALHGIDIEAAQKAQTPWEFDEYITRRLHGYSSVKEMYEDIGCDKYVQNVKVPTLIINSRKDPISPLQAIPFDGIRSNKNIILAMTRAGCHIEWYTGIIPRRWIMTPTIKYFEHILQEDSQAMMMS